VTSEEVPARRVVVVTDSTAHVSPAEAEALGISVVPLEVVISGRSGLDLVEVQPEEVARALSAWEPVTTSRPAPARFVAAYEQARADGAQAVVSVHLSGSLSGTVEAARLAAREAHLPVTVVDSQQIGLGFGFAVLAAARVAATGADAETVAGVVTRVLAGSSIDFYVDTLDYLRRGGRVGATSAFVGGVLAVKPLLTVRDGKIEALEKVRTTSRALARLADVAAERADGRPVQLAVQHLAAPQHAAQAATLLAQRLPQAPPAVVRELGAVIGAHVGPGVVAVVVAPLDG
jgi:DegV family protein with EDD domain